MCWSICTTTFQYVLIVALPRRSADPLVEELPGVGVVDRQLEKGAQLRRGKPMKIIGLLSFYDESPAWLSACVAGIGRWCDGLIAVDGAYAL
jgi:hypothetical protein